MLSSFISCILGDGRNHHTTTVQRGAHFAPPCSCRYGNVNTALLDMLSVKTSVQISLTVPLPGPLTCSGFPRGDQEPAWIHSGGCSSLCQVCARFTATRRMVPIAPLHPILCWLTCITSTEFQTKVGLFLSCQVLACRSHPQSIPSE